MRGKHIFFSCPPYKKCVQTLPKCALIFIPPWLIGADGEEEIESQSSETDKMFKAYYHYELL